MGSTGGNFSGEKFPPDPFQKTFKQGKGYNADPGFYRCGSAVQGLCARPLEIPTYGRPPGSTPGCRPPLRMTRRGGFCRSNAGATIIAMVAPALFIDIQRRNKRKPSPVGEGGSRRLTDEVSGINKFFPRTPHPPLPWSPFSHRRRLFY